MTILVTQNFDFYTDLLKLDQLRRAVNSKLAFNELEETLPDFPPTYKFDIGTQNYNKEWGEKINVSEIFFKSHLSAEDLLGLTGFYIVWIH